MDLVSTNLIVIPEGKVCDYVDEKFRNDTPEEYVRQTIEKRLVNEHKYPKDRIKVEHVIQSGSSKPRVDLAIFRKDTNYSQEDIQVIIECKKETVEPQNQKDGVGQLKSYMSACINCEWGMWTNGIQKIVVRKETDVDGKYEFKEWNDIPSADGSTDDIDRPKRTTLKTAVEDNLLFVFRTCHNHIFAMDGFPKEKAFFEFLKIIFCKIEDERNLGNPLEFYTTSEQRRNSDGHLTVKNRISKIFERVKKKYSKIFASNDVIALHPRSLAYIVSELQKYSLLNTNIDIKGRAYEEIVRANLHGNRGEFFTPRNVMRMVVNMIQPGSDERICDVSCGTGGFLVIAMTYVIERLEAEMVKDLGKPRGGWGVAEERLFREGVESIAKTNFFGFDINDDLVKATKMNMVMNNDGSGNILRTNTLLPPHEWLADFRSKLASALNVSPDEITNSQSIEFFDVIVTNPPFGSKIPIIDEQILKQYDLGHAWKRDASREWYMTSNLQSSVPPEQLFIERCLQMLKPKGRLGIVVPDSILGNPNLGYIRSWLIKNTRIIASIDLHADTFQPFTGVQTSILILQKKSRAEIAEEERTHLHRDYKIFMAMVEKIGYDKRGNTIFKRDEYGNELLIETPDVIEMGATADGNRTAQTVSKTKVVDDQTIEVPKIFHEWKRHEGLSW